MSSTLPVPTATTSPLIGFSVAESGITIPPAVQLLFFHALDDHAVVQRLDIGHEPR
ncbi:hypothetical protein [Providencia hangzhouensis]|uniref:hypothetical protein n=1 Tax=Providencia hangzhouensis TaxID=3031799 RepID=UPI003F6901ED